ncbi:MAG: protein kinase [Elusimicrobia bacterium]|nr:protein kinase [Elusimicrobiota bacterium]
MKPEPKPDPTQPTPPAELPPWEPPPSYQAPYEEFRDQLGQGNYDGAGQLADRLKEEHPKDPIPYRFAALAAIQQGDYPGALEQVRQGLELSPKDAGLAEMEHYVASRVGLPMKGTLHEPAARPPMGAEADMASTPERAAADGFGLAAVPITLRDPAAPREVGEARLLQRGLTEVRGGLWREAEGNFTRLIEKNPRRSDYFILRAMARRGLKDKQGALADADEGLRLNPGDPMGLKTRALILSELARHEEALAAIQAVLARNARDADSYRTRALVYEAMGKRAEAMADYESAAKLDPAAFNEIYRQALARQDGKADASGQHRRPPPRWLIYGLPLLLTLAAVGYALFRERGQTGFSQRAAPAEGGRETVGGFEVTGKLGQGGMGEVFEAVDRALDRKVAIKKMRSEIADDPRARKRFLKEARTVAALRHPNIIEIHSVLEEGDGLYLVFEVLGGDTLRGVLQDRGVLPLPEAVDLAAQVAGALDYAHGRGTVHQDLKPDNIMVEDGRAKVMDFGIARRVQDTLSTMTRNEVVGTPIYMAPEQESGVVAPSVDVFALGCCLYEMLTGLPPFTGSSPLQAKLNRVFVPAGRVNPLVTPALDVVLARALEPDPRNRFATAGELVAALRGAVPA